MHLRTFDPFQAQKQQAYEASKQAITSLGSYVLDICDALTFNQEVKLKEHFIQFMQVCSLSLSCFHLTFFEH